MDGSEVDDGLVHGRHGHQHLLDGHWLFLFLIWPLLHQQGWPLLHFCWLLLYAVDGLVLFVGDGRLFAGIDCAD